MKRRSIQQDFRMTFYGLNSFKHFANFCNILATLSLAESDWPILEQTISLTVQIVSNICGKSMKPFRLNFRLIFETLRTFNELPYLRIYTSSLSVYEAEIIASIMTWTRRLFFERNLQRNQMCAKKSCLKTQIIDFLSSICKWLIEKKPNGSNAFAYQK